MNSVTLAAVVQLYVMLLFNSLLESNLLHFPHLLRTKLAVKMVK